MLCEGVQSGQEIPRGLLPPSGLDPARLRRGTALEVACAHCLRGGARAFADDDEEAIDPECVDWLPVWIARPPGSGEDTVDVLHEDGTVEALVAPERLRRPAAGARNCFGLHEDSPHAE